ncbi:MAG: glycoside hydrolase family 65 protein [Saprospiraceae bacterium]|nr:glycoside hydrolase family 65 protein [Saprospiraceae bacterium]
MVKQVTFFICSLLSMSLMAQDSGKGWVVTAENIQPNEYYGETVANGMVGLISSPEPMKVKDVVLNGVFDQYGRGRVENILKVFNHINLDIFVDNKLANGQNISNFEQRLDLRKAVLITEFDFEGVHVVHKMRSLRHLPFNQLVEVELKASKPVSVRIQNKLETPDHLRDNRMFFNEISRPHVDITLMTSVAQSPTGRHKVAATSSFLFEEKHGYEPRIRHEEWDEGMHYQHFTKKLSPTATYRFGLAGTSIASEHVDDPHNEAERMALYAKLEGMDRLIKFHDEAWDTLWEGDIVIEGNDKDQLDVRSALYHLYSFVRAGSGYSMSPMGLSGLGYNGHVFWDTEIWMYPPLLVLQPEIARSLLDYRFNRLDAAMTNAKMHGYDGAMFPWESADTGSEQTPVWAITGPFEHHITGDIAWAAWQYFSVTNDMQWLEEKGYPLLKATADYWASRVERNGPGQYNIKNVVCADEYAENVDDNAFTNAGAILNLEYATKAANLLGKAPNPDWMHVAENIPILKFNGGVIQEHATYEGETIKQADVNLLAHPFYFVTDKTQIKRDLDYYEPRYDEFGPAMGFCTLATLHAQLDNEKRAYQLWTQSFRPNFVPPFNVISETKGGTNPYFSTGAGGMLQTVLWGFGGVRVTEDGIVVTEQKKPNEWKSLEIKGLAVR